MESIAGLSSPDIGTQIFLDVLDLVYGFFGFGFSIWIPKSKKFWVPMSGKGNGVLDLGTYVVIRLGARLSRKNGQMSFEQN